jgi:preprotein translocase subunit YajC
VKGKQEMNDIWILAQAAGENADFDIVATPVGENEAGQGQALTKQDASSDPNASTAPVRPRGPINPQSLVLIILMVVMIYFLFRGPRKKQQQHRQMVQSLKKNDRVRTIGGIIGTVVDIKDNEITLKVDESNNTKIKVTPTAIAQNVSEDKS